MPAMPAIPHDSPSSAAPPNHRLWADMASADFAALDTDRAIAVLPLGATEQHGPHLPLSVDTDIALAITRAAAAHLGDALPVLFLPALPVGFSPEHTGFAGTLSIKATTALALWGDIAECVAASGVRKLLLFNAHGGHTGLMEAATRDWRARLGLLAYAASWFNLPLLDGQGRDVMAERIPAAEQRFGVHGGQCETALMLAHKPHLVRMAQAQNFDSTSRQRAARHPILGNGKSAKFAWMAHDLNPHGVAGNAAAATAGDGRALLDAAARALAALLAEIDQLPADTLRPAPSPSPCANPSPKPAA